MHSSLLAKNGLLNMVAGTDFNFRYQTAGNSIVKDVGKVKEILNIQPKEIYTGQQMHGKKVAYADGENGERFVFGKTFKETDGLITDKPGVALLIKFADCTPIVLFDPIKKVHASVHSGWRGTTQRIALEAIEKMESDFGCQREDLLVYVGPSIDQDHYEVGSEVYDAFEGFKERDSFFKPGLKEGKYYLSMLDANLSILKEAGLKPEQMDIERRSTYTDESLHSARKEGKNYQLNGLLTMLQE